MSLLHRTTDRARIVGAAALAAVALVVVACSAKIDGTPIAPPAIASYVTGFQSDGKDLDSKTFDTQLDASGSGPEVDVVDQASVVNGGSVGQTVSSDKKFTKIRLAVAPAGASTRSTTSPGTRTTTPRTSSPRTTTRVATADVPVKGYEEITLPAPTDSIDLILSFPQELPESQFTFFYAVVDESGNQGPLAAQGIEAVEVATGDVQVTASWDVDSDVDIHVIDPSGDEVYYGSETVSSGGQLDLDSNAACNIDGVRNENITWEEAPPGEYTVLIDYFDACDVSETNYVVTVFANGKDAKIYTGTFTGSGDANSDPVEVATFTVDGGGSGTSSRTATPTPTR